MEIPRPDLLAKLTARRENGMVKVVTGVRRCGKSYLLTRLYRNHLLASGVTQDHIIELALDDMANARYRNPSELDAYVRARLVDPSAMYYVFLDEIQKVKTVANPYLEGETIGFVDVALGLMRMPNVDLYVTGSNSHMLSSDILTEFRGRGDEVRVHPLTYREFHGAYTGETPAWREYLTYGGMPFILSRSTHEGKSSYLKSLFTEIYLQDIVERNDIRNDVAVLGDLLDVVSSSVGSLTNPTRLANTFRSERRMAISSDTIGRYLDYFVDAYLIDKAQRYDVKGNRYIETPLKYYFTDVGLRNARLNFRQQEENHLMENVLYNDLRARGFDIDVGVVEYNGADASGKKVRTQLEVDFVANQGDRRYYIQSAWAIGDEEKRAQETASLRRIGDSFKKVVVVRDPIVPWHDDKGILYVGVERFLLDERAIDG